MSCNEGEYYSDGGASFEWLIDKLLNQEAFKLKKTKMFLLKIIILNVLNIKKKKKVKM